MVGLRPVYSEDHQTGRAASRMGLEGAKSSAEGARIQAPQAPSVCGSGYGKGVPGYGEGVPACQDMGRGNFGSQNAYFGAFSGPSRVFVSAL